MMGLKVNDERNSKNWNVGRLIQRNVIIILNGQFINELCFLQLAIKYGAVSCFAVAFNL